MSNPVLVELTRGPLVESIHRGALAVSGPTGELVLAMGDVNRPVYPRSAIKPLQALALLASGAADRWGLTDAEIALACASHAGAPEHVATAQRMLDRAGLAVSALGCGAHGPGDGAAARALTLAGAEPTALHNNCSGKHAGMLLTAAHRGEPLQGYWRPGHPVQVAIRTTLEQLVGRPLGPEVTGVDGCSVPNWALPVATLARAFAAFATGQGAGAPYVDHARRIMAACWAEPGMVGGSGRLDTEAMRRLPGELIIKTGAEGVYAAALPRAGLGIALKIDDGGRRAAEALVMAVVGRLLPQARDLERVGVIANFSGIEVGETRLSPEALAAIETLGG